MKPVVAASVAAALISGTAMYTLGARTSTVSAFSTDPLAGPAAQPSAQYAQYVPVQAPGAPSLALRPAAGTPARRTVSVPASQPAAPRRQRDARRDDIREEERRRDDSRYEESDRSWSKTALIIGGSAASGAGVGAVVNGKKGALIGAAIGGGAASIYEATQRR